MLGERCCRGVEDNATNTVQTHTRELCRRLGTTSPAEAVARRRTVCSSQINHTGDPRPALADPGPPSARFGSDVASVLPLIVKESAEHATRLRLKE
jgi:hypothetical protein